MSGHALSHQKSALGHRVLVTGVDAALGANLAIAFSGRFPTVGLATKHVVLPNGCRTLVWDRGSKGSLGELVRQEKPCWVVHCGAFCASSWDYPRSAPDATEEVRTCQLLIETSKQINAHFTVLSTDAIFAGPRMFHNESSRADSSEPFAIAARHVERALGRSEALVVRTHAYGWSPAEPSFAEQAWQKIIEARGGGIAGGGHATPILATDLAELLWLAYRRRLTGTWHIAGAERASAGRFVTELAWAIGLNGPADRQSPVAVTVGGETSLCTRRAQQALSRPMPMLREGLERFVAQAHNGYRASLQRIRSAALAAA